MPVCPRCGKCLSSEQALAYHLNKRYKCGSWKCLKCATAFDSKFQLQLHEFNCFENREETPSFDILRQMYINAPFIVMNVNKEKIISISPSCKNILGYNACELVGKNLNPVNYQGSSNLSYWTTKTNETINVIRNEIPHAPGYVIDQIMYT